MKRIISLVIAMTFIFNFLMYTTVYSAGEGDILNPIVDDSKEHNALQWIVQGVSTTAPKQAFVIGWYLTFSDPKGVKQPLTVYVGRSMDYWGSNPVKYTFPLTAEWQSISNPPQGIRDGKKSIRDWVSQGSLIYYDNLIENPDGCNVEANALIQKYAFDSSKPEGQQFTAYPYADENLASSTIELRHDFSEYTQAYLDNACSQYFEIKFKLPREKPKETNPLVHITQPDNSTVYVGTTVTFKGFGNDGVHHINGYVNNTYLSRTYNPSADTSVQMGYSDHYTFTKEGDYVFQLKGSPSEYDTEELLSETRTVHVVAKDITLGTIHVKNLDYDTNNVLSEYIIPNVPLNLAYPVTRQIMTDGSTYMGSYQAYTNSPDKSARTSATTQNITLTDANKEGYVYFWYEGQKAVMLPPVAVLRNDKVAYEGQDVNVSGASSYARQPGASIENYGIICYNAQIKNPNVDQNGQIDFTKSSGTTWYANQGTYNIWLQIDDTNGMSDETEGTVQILPALPQVNLAVSASQVKENRKIRLYLSGSSTAQRFEMNWDSATWTIEPVSGSGATGDYGVRFEDGTVYKNVNGIAYKYSNGTWTNTSSPFNSILTGQKTVYFQARDSGQYKFTATLSNRATYDSSKGYSDTVSKIITVTEDLSPVANCTAYSTATRGASNPNDPKLQKYANIPITDASSSPDGDTIGTRTWSFRYDSDNDGSFLDETTIYEYTGYSTFTSGYRLIVDSANSTVVKISTYDVGNYAPALEVKEDIPDILTVKELLIPTDYKSNYAKAW